MMVWFSGRQFENNEYFEVNFFFFLAFIHSTSTPPADGAAETETEVSFLNERHLSAWLTKIHFNGHVIH